MTSSTVPPAPPHPVVAEAPPLAAGQVWECVEGGEKIFSDKRCGGDASVERLGELNTMEAPAAPPAGSYGGYPPAYGGAYYPQPQPSRPDDAEDYPDEGSDGYAVGYAVARERWRREHHRHRDEHAHPVSTPHGMAPAARTVH